ncbi:MAG: hypothetical protein Q8Q94_02080 [bacterium]|nr:hypothetical protein [bacterium]MDZ4299424.1 hypothetical protein [Candidatus Sungbacteria bacterium]
MKDLMKFLRKRPKTWEERWQQLEDEHRLLKCDTGPFPHLFALLNATLEPFFWEAKKIVDVPLAISEERYPDQPNFVVEYWTGECDDARLSEFGKVFQHFSGYPWHKCDMTCTRHNLPKFIMREA